MKGELRITPDTEVQFSESSFQDVHLKDLDFVLDVEGEDGEVTSILIDVTKLVQAMTVFSSMEVFKYDWRAYGETGTKFEPTADDPETADANPE